MKTFVLIALSAMVSLGTMAQKKDYKALDLAVKNTGSMDSLNVAQIAIALTAPFEEKKEKSRAIFYWIAHNIQPDLKAFKSNDNKNILPEWTIKNRKATPLGFAMLYQEMSSTAGIRCLVVTGYLKKNSEDIGNKADEPNYAWNVVQLGQSPEDWHYVDVASASGIIDKKYTSFEPFFVSGYFFADNKLFNLDHFPENSAWLLGPGAKSIKDFYNQPVISPAAYVYGLQSMNPEAGKLKIKINKVTSFRYGISTESTINDVQLVMGENRRQKTEPMKFDVIGGKLVFDYQFTKDDEFPMYVMVNGRPFLSYQVEVIE